MEVQQRLAPSNKHGSHILLFDFRVLEMESHALKRQALARHFAEQGFRVDDGLKYGVDLLLYTDEVERVHSKYGVLIHREHTFLDLIGVQRTCSSANKTLVVAFFKDGEFMLHSFERELFVHEHE
jgi:tRNA splicing endonuclease